MRIGNAAHGQLQLDVFGEVMDALHQARRGGLESRDEDWAFQRALLEHLETIWEQPDEGHLGSARRRRGTSPTRRSWPGWRSTAASGRSRRSASKGPLDRWRAVRHDDPRGGLRARLRSRRWAASSSRTARRSSTPACCCCRLSAFCRRPIRASAARSRRSSGACSSTASCCATTPRPARRRAAGRRGRVPGLQLLAGRRLRADGAHRRRASGCSSGCWRCATTSACWPRNTTPAPGVWSATSRRRSRTSRSSTPRTIWRARPSRRNSAPPEDPGTVDNRQGGDGARIPAGSIGMPTEDV